MSKNRPIRKRILRENYTQREQALLAAVGKLRVGMLEFTKGPNWAVKHHDSIFRRWSFSPQIVGYIWVGEGNPQQQAERVMVEVFGKDYNKVVPKEGEK